METVLAAAAAAFITSAFPVIFAMRASKHARTAVDVAAESAKVGVETRDIVRGNGHGTVTALGERIEAKLDDVLAWQGRHEALHVRQGSRTT